MLKKIYEKVKEYKIIVIARHIGVDPDALGAQLALKESLKLAFNDKEIYAIGAKSVKYNYFPKLDKFDPKDKDALLIVVDTPDKKRIDVANVDLYKEICKIDHHPVIDVFGPLEYVDTTASSASELVYRFIRENDLQIDPDIAKYLFLGIISDTNRFLFNSNPTTLRIIAELIEKYHLDIEDLYQKLYLRPLNEIKLQGYISQNMVVTENKLAYTIITNDVMTEYGVDASSAGNLINNFNNIEEVLVWVTVSEDLKNNIVKFNIRSRGPIINTVAEKYKGGGHQFASGARLSSMDEVMPFIKDLDKVCKEYIESQGERDEF